MVVPRGVDDVDEPHAALDQATGEEAVGGVSLEDIRARATAASLRGETVDTVKFQRGFALTGQVNQLGGGSLHPVRQFIGGDAAGYLGVLNLFVAERIQRSEQV